MSEEHLCSRGLSTNSTSGFTWEVFEFEMCNNFDEGRTVWVALTMLWCAFGFPASVAVLWELFKTYKRGTPFTPSDIFILNLSVMDFVFMVFTPFGILNNFTWKNWPLNAFSGAVYALNTCGRPLLMACVCLDCYLAVVHPITYHKKKSLTPRVVMAAIVWMLTLATGIVYLICYRVYFTPFTTVPYIIAVVVIVICDSLIVHTLIKSDPGRKNIHPQKQRAIQTLINSLVMTVLIFLPPVFMFTVGRHLIPDTNVFMCTIAIPITITPTFGSVVMPLLHLQARGKLDGFRLGCCRKS